MVSHTAQRQKGEGPYMDLNSALLRPFLEGVGLTKKQNRHRLVGSHVCTTAALNQTISGEELGHYKWYQNLIFGQKCTNEDV